MSSKTYYPNSYAFILSVLLLALMSNAAQAVLPAVVVKTYGQHMGGNIVFTHAVTNNGSRNVVAVAIALDTDYQGSSLPYSKAGGELDVMLPVGSGGVTNSGETKLTIDPASMSGPAGWKAQIIQIQDSGRYMKWYSPGYPQPPIQPGQTYRFSVTVPAYAQAYLTGHFSASYADGTNPWAYNGTMEKLDILPPSLMVSLSPNILHSSDRLVPIAAQITVRDDYDPAPEIKLVSITANEVLEAEDVRDAAIGTDDRSFRLRAEHGEKSRTGRIYTVTYSATDASGNTATASATVTVPREQEGKEHVGKHPEHEPSTPQKSPAMRGAGALPF